MHGTFDGEEFGQAIVQAIKTYVDSKFARLEAGISVTTALGRREKFTARASSWPTAVALALEHLPKYATPAMRLGRWPRNVVAMARTAKMPPDLANPPGTNRFKIIFLSQDKKSQR